MISASGSYPGYWFLVAVRISNDYADRFTSKSIWISIRNVWFFFLQQHIQRIKSSSTRKWCAQSVRSLPWWVLVFGAILSDLWRFYGTWEKKTWTFCLHFTCERHWPRAKRYTNEDLGSILVRSRIWEWLRNDDERRVRNTRDKMIFVGISAVLRTDTRECSHLWLTNRYFE